MASSCCRGSKEAAPPLVIIVRSCIGVKSGERWVEQNGEPGCFCLWVVRQLADCS
jgi:hypothetical protein